MSLDWYQPEVQLATRRQGAWATGSETASCTQITVQCTNGGGGTGRPPSLLRRPAGTGWSWTLLNWQPPPRTVSRTSLASLITSSRLTGTDSIGHNGAKIVPSPAGLRPARPLRMRMCANYRRPAAPFPDGPGPLQVGRAGSLCNCPVRPPAARLPVQCAAVVWDCRPITHIVLWSAASAESGGRQSGAGTAGRRQTRLRC